MSRRVDKPKPKRKPLAHQLERLHAHVQAQGETVAEQAVFRDAGYRGASLSRPGLDQLRDRAALAEFDRVVVRAPDRLARKYVHQVLLLEERRGHGCAIGFPGASGRLGVDLTIAACPRRKAACRP